MSRVLLNLLRIFFLLALSLSLMTPISYAKGKGAFLISFEVINTVPFKFTLNNGRFKENSYGDKVFEGYIFPFTLSSSLGYIYKFNKTHSIYNVWNIAYNDDPINYLSDSSLGSKEQPSATLSLQSIDQSFTFGYKWRVLSYLGLAWKISPSLLFLRTTTTENFRDGFYNNHRYTTGIDLVFNRLQSISPKLQGFEVSFGGKYGYNSLPNYENDTLNKGLSLLNDLGDSDDEVFEAIPSSTEDYQNLEGRTGLQYAMILRTLPLIFFSRLHVCAGPLFRKAHSNRPQPIR